VFFSGLKNLDGCGARLWLVEHAGDTWDQSTQSSEVHLSVGGADRKGGRGRAAKVSPTTCQALGAFGHGQRVKIMAKLLEGPATYRSLQRVTKLKAGPLYHHINQLRLAGLILPKQRDLYELTRGGRNLMLTAMVMGPLIRDARRRP